VEKLEKEVSDGNFEEALRLINPARINSYFRIGAGDANHALIHLIAEKGNIKLLQELIEKEKAWAPGNKVPFSPPSFLSLLLLFIVSLSFFDEVALLKVNWNILTRGNEKLTALKIAERGGFKDIVTLLAPRTLGNPFSPAFSSTVSPPHPPPPPPLPSLPSSSSLFAYS